MKSRTSPSAFLMTMALLDFLGGMVKFDDAGAGLAELTLGVCVCEMWLTLVIAGVEGCATADDGRWEVFEGLRDMA